MNNFQTSPAKAAPMNGATTAGTNIKALSPTFLPSNIETTSADKPLAGLTDVPVSGIPTKWIPNKATPINNPAKPPHSFLDVAPRTKRMKRNVKTTSAKTARPNAANFAPSSFNPTPCAAFNNAG